MKKVLDILIVEDHPLVIEAYKSSFGNMSTKNKNLKFKITSAMCFETAHLRIAESAVMDPINLVLLDLYHLNIKNVIKLF